MQAAIQARAVPRGKLIAAFAAVYFVWGSTYVAIRLALNTLPPLLMSGTRFIVAGLLLYGILRWRGVEPPRRENWRAAAILGVLFFLGGNGALVWAQQRVPSGMAALMLAGTPMWIVLIDSLNERRWPRKRVIAGLALGFAGISLLVGPAKLAGSERVDPLGAIVLTIGSIAWSFGVIASRRMLLPRSAVMAAAMEMIAGGIMMTVAALPFGELGRFDPQHVALSSVLGWLYLLFFGSLVGFVCFVWLTANTTPARLSTYSYVNPLVAVVLGWAILREPITARVITATAVILSGVALIFQPRPAVANEPPEPVEPV
jgi:drug/metabolite transporter (DMT)-like permease